MIVSRQNAEHYKWGQQCDGWILAPGRDLTIIEERMPAGTAEIRHFHARARQFFFVLSGVLTMELEGAILEIGAHQGLQIDPDSRHQARNDGDVDAVFLVVSAPTTRGDRVDVPIA